MFRLFPCEMPPLHVFSRYENAHETDLPLAIV